MRHREDGTSAPVKHGRPGSLKGLMSSPGYRRRNYPWTITSLTSFENVKSARSAIIPNKTESVLSIYVNNPVSDTISFYSLVSSEANFDSLVFRVDSVNVICSFQATFHGRKWNRY